MRRIFAIAISLALLVVTAGLATAEPGSWPGNAQQAINSVIQRALSQRGVPYTYGGGNVAGPSRRPDPRPAPVPAPAQTPGLIFPQTGTSPLVSTNPAAAVDPTANTVGFDASGLIVYAFAGAGIKMPRSSGDQFKVGRKILPSQALPGDLIFYGPDGTQSVALFVGNGQMVEATEPVVTVSPVRTNGMTPYLTRIIG
jgi:cell wall-associated NlpC family hydrolase